MKKTNKDDKYSQAPTKSQDEVSSQFPTQADTHYVSPAMRNVLRALMEDLVELHIQEAAKEGIDLATYLKKIHKK